MAPVKAITRWTARAVVLFAVSMTPIFQLHATHLAKALPAPTIPMPPVLARLLQAAVAAARAKLFTLSALFALHIAPRLPAAVPVPAAVPLILTNPLALNVGRASASAGAAAVLVCAALPPTHTAPATNPNSLAIEEEEEEEEEEAALPIVHTAVRCTPLSRQLAHRSLASRLARSSRRGVSSR